MSVWGRRLMGRCEEVELVVGLLWKLGKGQIELEEVSLYKFG
jgi:hypothetical protein